MKGWVQVPVISTQSPGSEECYNNKNHKNPLNPEFDIISDFLVSDKSRTKEEQERSLMWTGAGFPLATGNQTDVPLKDNYWSQLGMFMWKWILTKTQGSYSIFSFEEKKKSRSFDQSLPASAQLQISRADQKAKIRGFIWNNNGTWLTVLENLPDSQHRQGWSGEDTVGAEGGLAAVEDPEDPQMKAVAWMCVATIHSSALEEGCPTKGWWYICCQTNALSLLHVI